ncbi:hypothetical protein MSPP1_002283 [Malassezia sp. CBS 17886]|nr:hypothetical protein MSPP1_002283 [Malassezia sp. CBS 17886]
MQMLDEKKNNDTEVSWDDQQKINRFSRLHATFSDVEEELHARRSERSELEDLGMELELMDGDTILYKVGDTFVSMAQEDAVEQLAKDTASADEELARLEKTMDTCEEDMNGLKVALYAKFGSNINLER